MKKTITLEPTFNCISDVGYYAGNKNVSIKFENNEPAYFIINGIRHEFGETVELTKEN